MHPLLKASNCEQCKATVNKAHAEISHTPATSSPFFSYTFLSGYDTVVRSNIKSKRCYLQLKKKS